MVAKCDLYKKKQGKDLLQGLSKKVFGGYSRKDNHDQYESLTEIWIKENYDDRVKECWPVKNGKWIDNLQVEADVGDQDLATSINQMPYHFRSHILGQSKLLMNSVIRDFDGFYSISFYCRDTDSSYTQKKTLVNLVEKKFRW